MAKIKGAAFGWHRLTLAQLAVNIAVPALTNRGLASISDIGMEATVARLIHRLKAEGRVGRFQPIARPRHLAFREESSDFDGWTVVDFKTDQEFSRESGHYVAQVRIYPGVHFLRTIKVLNPIQAGSRFGAETQTIDLLTP